MKNDDLIISDYKTIFVYKMRKYFPKTELFYYIYYIFKFIGVMLATHNVKNLEKKNQQILYLNFFTLLSLEIMVFLHIHHRIM